jgi:ribosomal protein S18 acetylase RimI-like enzyme
MAAPPTHVHATHRSTTHGAACRLLPALRAMLQDRCYLCNMATHPDHRGRGYGLAVMRAAEQLVGQLGESEIYLHLRQASRQAAGLARGAAF